mgnify:CR=1 FL=1
MSKVINNPAVKKLVLSIAGIPLLKKLEKASRDIKSSQNRVLSGIIESCKDTAFGKEHNLSAVKNYEDFRKAVPVNDYEGHRKYIERMCRGEQNVLFPGKPVFYNTTSGTTDKPKLIPVSEQYYKKAYSGVSRLWFYTALKDNPRLFHGKNLSFVAPAQEGKVEDGTPFGSISGVVYKNIPGILKDLYSTPYPVICMKDYDKKYYAMLRFSLACNITYIITVNPSTVLQLHRTALQEMQSLIKDIHDGTLRPDVASEFDPSIREQTLRMLRPDPSRAAELERLAGVHGEQLRPKHYWPDLECVNTWKQGNCTLILPKLQGFFPDKTVLREFGYQASEARAGMVLGNEWDYSVLMAHIYHFEFIEESQRQKENPEVLGAHELEIGKNYYILFSNGSGLFRYDINDIVRVDGFLNQFPLFKFLQKGEGVTSLTGEKLSEQHVIGAVDAASIAKNIKLEFYTMFCDTSDFTYKLYAEFPAGTAQNHKKAFLESVDEHIKFTNLEYAAKRGSNRLNAPKLVDMKPNSYENLKARLLAEGKVREGQYKVSYLKNDPVLQKIYDEMLLTPER